MPLDEELKGKINNEYLPQLEDYINKALQAYYAGYGDAEEEIKSYDYMLIDGLPVSHYIMEKVGDNNISMDEKKAVTPKVILKAMLEGRRVCGAIPESKTGAFKADNVAPFEFTDALASLFADENVKQGMLETLADIPSAENNLSAQEIMAREYDTALLLENRSKFAYRSAIGSDRNFMKQDVLRDIMKNPKYSPQANPDAAEGAPADSPSEILDRIRRASGMKFTFNRDAFMSHSIAMLFLDGVDPEIIFDPERGADLRADAGNRLLKLCEAGDVKGILKINLEAAEKINRFLDKELKSIDFNDPQALASPRSLALMQMARYAFDMLQERDRYMDESYEVLAEMDGEHINTPEDKAKYKEKYSKITDESFAYNQLRYISENQINMTNAALGIHQANSYDALAVPTFIASEVIKNVISEAQKNNTSIVEALKPDHVQKIINISPYSDEKSVQGLDIINGLISNGSWKKMQETGRSLLDGSFAAKHDFYFKSVENDGKTSIIPVIEEKQAYSKHEDHPISERDFYTAEFTNPSSDTHELTGNQAGGLDRDIFMALKDNFGIVYGQESQSRIYALDENNQLVSMDGKDFTAAAGKVELRRLALQGRLFAVKDNENVPVQLNFRPHDNLGMRNMGRWTVTAADCLDRDPEPVEYKWYHKLGNLLGIASCVAQKEAYERYLSRSIVAKAVQAAAESRKPLTTFAEISRKNLEKDNAKQIENAQRIKQNYKTVEPYMKPLKNFYGTKPEYSEALEKGNVYTKEEFDSLKKYDLNLEEGKELSVDSDGKIKFREEDFVNLAIAAAVLPEIGGHMRDSSSADSSLIDPAMVVDVSHTMFLNDLCQNYDKVNDTAYPRDRAGQYLQNTAAPAREMAAAAIEEYRKGNNEALARLIANGLAFASRNFVGTRGDFTPANRALAACLNGYGKLLEADPKLAQAVRDKCEEIKADAAAAKAKNLKAKEEFLKENKEYIEDVTKTMRGYHKMIDNKKLLTGPGEREAKSAEQLDYISKHEKFYELVQREPIFDAMDSYYNMNMNLDVDKTLKGIQHQQDIFEAIDKRHLAEQALASAELNNITLTPEQKEKYMEDIFRGSLIETCEKQAFNAQHLKNEEIINSNKSVVRVGNSDIVPRVEITDMDTLALSNKYQTISSNLSTVYSNCGGMLRNERLQECGSLITDAIMDPVNGKAALEEIYNNIVPNKKMFTAMGIKPLLNIADKSGKIITDYQIKLNQNAKAQQAEEKALEKTEVMQKNAEDKVLANQEAPGLSNH